MFVPEEISRQLNDSNTKTLVTIPALWENAKAAVALTKRKIPIIAVATQVRISFLFLLINDRFDMHKIFHAS